LNIVIEKKLGALECEKTYFDYHTSYVTVLFSCAPSTTQVCTAEEQPCSSLRQSKGCQSQRSYEHWLQSNSAMPNWSCSL